MIPTLSKGFLYQVNKHRQRWLTELERRRAARYFIAVCTVVTIIVIAWIVRPL